MLHGAVIMKKSKLLLLFAIVPSVISLSGCFSSLFKKNEEIVVELPTINVVESLKINLNYETEKRIVPSLSDSSISNPKFLYSSSNSSVATVNNEGVISGIDVGEATITVKFQANQDVKANVKVNVVRETRREYDYTIMYYMCGSDLEYIDDQTRQSDQAFFTRDIQEILSVDIPSNVKLIIETGGAKKWFLTQSYLDGATKISSTNLQRWEVSNHKLKLIDTLDANHMATEASFTSFLSWGLDDYYATQMGVVISGHGGGLAGCAYDDNYTYKYGDNYFDYTLLTNQVGAASQLALANSTKDKFTWIGYDCCLMQCADIATINAQSYEYMVASQETELASGWDHDQYLPMLASNPYVSPETFLPKICSTFVSQYHTTVCKTNNPCLQTLSVLDLSKINPLITAFNNLTTEIGGVSSRAYNVAAAAFNNCYNSFGESVYGLCDMVSFMNELSDYSSAASVISAVRNLVIANEYCSRYEEDVCGLNAFFPMSLDGRYSLQVGRNEYSVLSTKFTTWQAMCYAFGNYDF